MQTIKVGRGLHVFDFRSSPVQSQSQIFCIAPFHSHRSFPKQPFHIVNGSAVPKGTPGRKCACPRPMN